MDVRTHPRISAGLVGEPELVEPGLAEARLVATADMAADDQGLVHGGFTFGLADYAAMLAVNEPNVVLGGSEVKFLAPVRVGETMLARAQVVEKEGRRFQVHCVVSTDRRVMEGTFACFVLERHVLSKD